MDTDGGSPGRSGDAGGAGGAARLARRAILLAVAGAGVGAGATVNRRAPARPAEPPPPAAPPAAAPALPPAGPLSPAPALSVADFGAVGDGVTDSTAAIQAALDAARERIGDATGNDVVARKVVFPAGRFRTTASLRVPPNTTLVGTGPGSSYLAADGGFDALVLADRTAVQCEIRSLGIVCNGAGGGINFADQSYGPSVLGDTRHVVDDVVVVGSGPGSYGIGVAGTECRLGNITVQRAAGTALYLGGSDHLAHAIDVHSATGGSAVVVDSSNCRVVDLKIFGSTGPVAVGGYRNTFLGLEMQDCGPGGAVVISGHDTVVSGLLVDSCENSAGAVLTVDGTDNRVEGTILAHRAGGAHTASYALQVSPQARHHLELQLVGPFGRGASVTSGGLLGNALTVHAARGFATPAVEAGTLAPSPLDSSGYLVEAVTGDLTIANPVSSLSPAGAADFWPGLTLAFLLQGAGRHALRFGDRYALAGAAPALAGHVQLEFVYDGATWRESGRSVT